MFSSSFLVSRFTEQIVASHRLLLVVDMEEGAFCYEFSS